MADYHFVYKDVEGASTQWDDIQRKLGNLPPKPAPFKPPAFTPAPDEASLPKDKSWIDEKTEDQLEDLEDDPDLDDDRFLEEYRCSFLLFYVVLIMDRTNFNRSPLPIWFLRVKVGIQLKAGTLWACFS